MSKKLLIGNFGSRNIGDLLILWAAIEELGEENCLVMIEKSQQDFVKKFLQKNIQTIDRVAGGIRSGVGEYGKKSKENTQISEIIFIGGGLFAIHFRACLVWTITFYALTKKYPKIPIKFQHQGIDKKQNFLARYFIKKIFNHHDVKQVSVRDKSSKEALERFHVKKNIQVQDDRVVHYLKNSTQDFLLPSTSKNLIILNLVKKISAQKATELIQKIEKKYGKKQEIIFLNFEPKDEKNLPANFPGKIITPQNISQIFQKISQSKALIGERFHAIVLGQYSKEKNGTDVFLVRESYSEKVKNFAQKQHIKSLDKEVINFDK